MHLGGFDPTPFSNPREAHSQTKDGAASWQSGKEARVLEREQRDPGGVSQNSVG
jgi:hypothetical protein